LLRRLVSLQLYSSFDLRLADAMVQSFSGISIWQPAYGDCQCFSGSKHWKHFVSPLPRGSIGDTIVPGVSPTTCLCQRIFQQRFCFYGSGNICFVCQPFALAAWFNNALNGCCRIDLRCALAEQTDYLLHTTGGGMCSFDGSPD